MGRKKIAISKILDERNRQVTFTKRKWGLMKKAYELSILCECEIALVIFNGNNRLFQYASSDMDTILLKYTSCDEPHESKTNRDIADLLSKKDARAGDSDNEEEAEGGGGGGGVHASQLTPNTEMKYNEINREFEMMVHGATVCGGGGGTGMKNGGIFPSPSLGAGGISPGAGGGGGRHQLNEMERFELMRQQAAAAAAAAQNINMASNRPNLHINANLPLGSGGGGGPRNMLLQPATPFDPRATPPSRPASNCGGTVVTNQDRNSPAITPNSNQMQPFNTPLKIEAPDNHRTPCRRHVNSPSPLAQQQQPMRSLQSSPANPCNNDQHTQHYLHSLHLNERASPLLAPATGGGGGGFSYNNHPHPMGNTAASITPTNQTGTNSLVQQQQQHQQKAPNNFNNGGGRSCDVSPVDEFLAANRHLPPGAAVNSQGCDMNFNSRYSNSSDQSLQQQMAASAVSQGSMRGTGINNCSPHNRSASLVHSDGGPPPAKRTAPSSVSPAPAWSSSAPA